MMKCMIYAIMDVSMIVYDRRRNRRLGYMWRLEEKYNKVEQILAWSNQYSREHLEKNDYARNQRHLQ